MGQTGYSLFPTGRIVRATPALDSALPPAWLTAGSEQEAEPSKKAPPPAGKQPSSAAPRGDRADGVAAPRNGLQGREAPPAAAPHAARTLQKVKSKDGPCRGQASEIFAHLPQHRVSRQLHPDRSCEASSSGGVCSERLQF